MKFRSTKCAVILFVFVFLAAAVEISLSAQNTVTCFTRTSKCFLKRLHCPAECPFIKPPSPKAKACYLDCRKCEVYCRGTLMHLTLAFFFSVSSANRIIHIDEDKPNTKALFGCTYVLLAFLNSNSMHLSANLYICHIFFVSEKQKK